MYHECEKVIDNLREIERFLASEENKLESISSFLVNYFDCKETVDEIPLYFFGLGQREKLLKYLREIKREKIWEESLLKKAKEYLDKSLEPSTSYKDRKENLDRAIKLLTELYIEREDKVSLETLYYLAKLYFLRSKLILPKGFTIPSKKIEAIEKGILYADKALMIDRENKEVNKLIIQLYLEKTRYLPQTENEQKFKALLNRVKEIIGEKLSDREDVRVLVEYSRIMKDTSKLHLIKNSKLEDIEYEKSMAALIENDENGFEINFIELINNQLKKRLFSDPLWDYAVDLLITAKERGLKVWTKLSIKLWEVCREIEEKIASPLYIRWYWSKMKPLYDLTFLSSIENEPNKQVEIVESIKNRTLIKLNQIEKLSFQYENIRKYYEAYARGYYGNYFINLRELPHFDNLKLRIKSIKNIESLSKELTYVIFYLSDSFHEKKGYAIILEFNSENFKLKTELFDYKNLYEAYIEWYKNYINQKLSKLDYFFDLFKSISDSLKFLSNFKDRKILFVPHGFLSKIPIHAAMIDDRFLLDYCLCAYIPTLNLLSINHSEKIQIKKSSILIKNFENYDFNKIKKNFEVLLDPASFKDISKESFISRVVTFLCHGKADSLNPFNSHLKLHKRNLSLIDILTSENLDFTDSTVILGACESDFMPKTENPVDEFLSITSSFLLRGAKRVLASMWEIEAPVVEEMLVNVLDSDDMVNAFWEWQRMATRNLKDTELLSVLALRLIGTP